jgi:hypothetical protein
MFGLFRILMIVVPFNHLLGANFYTVLRTKYSELTAEKSTLGYHDCTNQTIYIINGNPLQLHDPPLTKCIIVLSCIIAGWSQWTQLELIQFFFFWVSN